MKERKPAPTYHIIGAGIAGLSCAMFAKLENPEAKTIIYEAAGKIGGRCYSFYDEKLEHNLDNAVHAVIGANKYAARLIGAQGWHKKCWFWNAKDKNEDVKLKTYVPHILMSMCNTSSQDIAPSIIKKIFWKMFPFLPRQRKIYFSQQDLSQRLINPMMQYIDVLYENCKLEAFEKSGDIITRLHFSNGKITIGDNDKIISALDDKNYAAIFGGESFEHNSIVNIFYRTSQNVTLRYKAPIVGVIDGLSHWIMVDKDIIAATISAAKPFDFDQDELARRVWQEIGNIRDVNQAFIPPYRVIAYKSATIRQDEANNAKRPESAQTFYQNLNIAGDWTMKDYPCCIEAAILSAKRAVCSERKE